MEYHIHLSSKPGALRVDLKEIWKYRDLIILLTKRSFKLTYKQTILGPLWLFLNPFLSSMVYAFVFGGIAGMSTDGVPHILFYLCGNAIWIYFSTCVTKNANTFTANANVFGKVYFPRLVVPVSNVISSAIQFGIQMILVLVFLTYYLIKGQVSPNWLMWFTLPIVLIHLGLLGLGFGIIISSLTTKYRDLSILVTFGMQLWMYVSPIVYPISEIGTGWMRLMIMMNPVTAPIELFRYAVLGVGIIDMGSLTVSWIITIIVINVGVVIFNKVEKTFMDTV